MIFIPDNDVSDVKKCKSIAQTPIISTEFGACKVAFSECKKKEDAAGSAALKCCRGVTRSTRIRRKWSFNFKRFKL